jgi:leucyl aminopeptidase
MLGAALTYGEEKYTPAAVVDMATLTGMLTTGQYEHLLHG